MRLILFSIFVSILILSFYQNIFSTSEIEVASKKMPPTGIIQNIQITNIPTKQETSTYSEDEYDTEEMPSQTLLPPLYQSQESALVVAVIDGDTVELDTGRIVRYIGIDTPELKSNDCYSSQAKQANAELVLGRRVDLVKDVSETDRYRRLLRYVWIDGAMVNETLVQKGYAKAYTYPPDVAYADLFTRRQEEARQNNVGLWGECYGKQTIPIADGECVIKGNISVSTGEKIYHVPQDTYYAETIINEEKGERWFCSEEEAIAAGWRRTRQ